MILAPFAPEIASTYRYDTEEQRWLSTGIGSIFHSVYFLSHSLRSSGDYFLSLLWLTWVDFFSKEVWCVVLLTVLPSLGYVCQSWSRICHWGAFLSLIAAKWGYCFHHYDQGPTFGGYFLTSRLACLVLWPFLSFISIPSLCDILVPQVNNHCFGEHFCPHQIKVNHLKDISAPCTNMLSLGPFLSQSPNRHVLWQEIHLQNIQNIVWGLISTPTLTMSHWGASITLLTQ